MGVAISDWKLAKAVSTQGQLGVISGVGFGEIMACRLGAGDVGGHVRRALRSFPIAELADSVIDKYYVAADVSPRPPQRLLPMWTLEPSLERIHLTILGGFVEVFLAKEGHDKPVGVNLLEKIQLPILASLYGAMLAGVDVVLMGAGIPMQVPGILDTLAEHGDVDYRLDVQGKLREDDYRIRFSPSELFPELAQKVGPLVRPLFWPIVASVVLAMALARKATGRVDGFIVEKPQAGGHNAPPRGALKLDEAGEPIYGDKDVVDLARSKALGKPFWLAGGYDRPDRLREALTLGATGIQAGTIFALCDESGMDSAIKERVLRELMTAQARVRTDVHISPTGFPFKVVELEGTQSEREVVAARERLCDRGMLRQLYKRDDGRVGFRCPGEPEKMFLRKGGEAKDMEGKGCLCNGLLATAGFAQRRKDGYVEPALVTLGDGLDGVRALSRDGQQSYSAKNVLAYLCGEQAGAMAEGGMAEGGMADLELSA